MTQRSPILGYNHNVSYRGLVFHVQTEDSGVNNPHIFTHLFHGGVIISTRKLEYDAEAAEDVVKSLMQAQHKAVLKDLKRGDFSERIEAYLGAHPDLLPPGVRPHPGAKEIVVEAAAAGKGAPEPIDLEDSQPVDVPIAISHAEVSDAFEAIVDGPRLGRVGGIPVMPAIGTKSGPMRNPSPVAPAPPPVVRSDVPPPVPPRRTTVPRPGSDSGQARRTPIKPPPPPVMKPEGGPPPPPSPRSTPRPSGNVLVSRPPIMVGGNRGTTPQRAPAPSARPAQRPPRLTPARTVREEPPEGIFDKNLISEKSLDEVILAYLSEDPGED